MNCFKVCGPKTGQPLLTTNLVSCLDTGEAKRVKNAIDSARSEWSARLPMDASGGL